jgi:hypothetical protein
VNENYKEYIGIYQELYGNTLDDIFSIGYLMFGSRKGGIFNPIFKNSRSIIKGGDVVGRINFSNENVSIKLMLGYLNISGTQFTNCVFQSELIKNYEIGKIYSLSSFGTPHPYFIILNDNVNNPVFVVGFVPGH